MRRRFTSDIETCADFEQSLVKPISGLASWNEAEEWEYDNDM
jgi:hypothetical protein